MSLLLALVVSAGSYLKCLVRSCSLEVYPWKFFEDGVKVVSLQRGFMFIPTNILQPTLPKLNCQLDGLDRVNSYWKPTQSQAHIYRFSEKIFLFLSPSNRVNAGEFSCCSSCATK